MVIETRSRARGIETGESPWRIENSKQFKIAGNNGSNAGQSNKEDPSSTGVRIKEEIINNSILTEEVQKDTTEEYMLRKQRHRNRYKNIMTMCAELLLKYSTATFTYTRMCLCR